MNMYVYMYIYRCMYMCIMTRVQPLSTRSISLSVEAGLGQGCSYRLSKERGWEIISVTSSHSFSNVCFILTVLSYLLTFADLK